MGPLDFAINKLMLGPVDPQKYYGGQQTSLLRDLVIIIIQNTLEIYIS